MPFPTVNGKTFMDLVRDFVSSLHLTYHQTSDLMALFEQANAVSTQLYDDVQKLKHFVNVTNFPLANDLGIEDYDPSQTPIADKFSVGELSAAQTFHQDDSDPSHPVLRPDPSPGTSDESPFDQGAPLHDKDGI